MELTGPYSVCSLYSGSKGNSVFIKSPGARILIDAGKSARALCNALAAMGECIDDVDAIFITHEHADHVSALEVLLKKHDIPVHIVKASAEKLINGKCSAVADRFRIHTPLFSETVGDMTVTSFVTPHDSDFSVGYRIDIGEHHIGYATDIGYITDEIRQALSGCETVVIESNHDTELLEDGPYPYELKKRIRSKHGHLSNRECADFACELRERGTRNILLAHLSEENNRPDIAFDETFSALADENINLKVADQFASVILV